MRNSAPSTSAWIPALFSPPEEGETKNGTLAFHLVVGAVIFAFAVSLRINLLAPSSLWLDDAWVALVARMNLDQVSQIGMTSFGFYTILWGWLHLVRFSNFQAQLIPFLAGCFGPVAVYALVIRKKLAPAAGVIAALLLVVAPKHVLYSATVKQYTTEALLVIFLIWFAWTVLEKPTLRNYIALSALSCFTVFVSCMPVFAVISAICIPIAWMILQRKPGIAQCVIIVAFTMAFVGACILILGADASEPTLRQTWASFLVDRNSGLRGVVVSSWGLAKSFAGGFTRRPFVLVILALVVAVLLAARRRPVLTVMVCGPVIFLYLASLTGRAPFGAGRTDIFLYPLMAILAALALDEMFHLFGKRSSGKFLSPVAAIVLAATVLVGERREYLHHEQEDVRPLAQLVMNQRQKGDKLLVWQATRFAWFLYSKEPFSVTPKEQRPRVAPFFYTMKAKNTIVLDEQELGDVVAYDNQIDHEIRADGDWPDRVWFIVSHPGPSLVVIPGIEGHIQSMGYRLQRKEERTGAFVELWIHSVEQK